jgi:hypothetical protein
MKCRIVVLIIFLPLFASAQNKETIDSLAKSKLTDLLDTWSLGISDSADLDIEVFNKFKRLFDSSATIDDDLNVFYEYAGVKKPGVYRASGKPEPFDIYAHDIALAVQIKNITIVNPGSIVDSNSNDPMKRIFRIGRDVDFKKTGKFVLPGTYADAVMKSRSIEPKSESSKRDFILNAGIKKNEDSIYKFTSKETLRVTMAFNSGLNTVTITGIKIISNEIRCTNDADGDAVTASQDSLSKIPGDITANGRPDYDLDGIADKDDKCSTTFGTIINKGCPIEYFYTKYEFDLFLGWQSNSAKINLPELNQLGYLESGKDAIDVLQSKKGVLKNPGQTSSISAGGNFIYYFGKRKKKSGISVGIDYTRFNPKEYKLVEPMVYTFKSFDGTDYYRRQITISNKEDINYNVFNLPVMFNYRWHPGKKNNSVIKLQAGPSLIIFKNISNYNAVIDFGGIYQIDTIQKNRIVYYDPFNNTSIYNIFLTSDSINIQSQNPGANNVFQQLKNSGNYDFESKKNYIGKQNLQRLSVAFNIGLDLQQKISEGLTIKFGATFVYGPLSERKEKYKPIDKTSDEFQSVYYSTEKSYYSAFGANVGLVYNW